MAFASMAESKTTLCVLVASVVLGILCLIGSVIGFYHESSQSKVLQIDDGSQKIYPFKTDDVEGSNGFSSMLQNTKGDKGDRGPVGKTVRGPMGSVGPQGPPGNPGMPGPPGGGIGSSSGSYTQMPLSCQANAMIHSTGNVAPLACPLKARSQDVIVQHEFDSGSLVFLEHEDKLILKTSKRWVEVNVKSVQVSSYQPPPKKEIPTLTEDKKKHVHEEDHRNEVVLPPVWSPKPNNNVRSKASSQQIRLVALNEKRNGMLGGVRGADLLCQRDAERSNVVGNFRAFLPSVSYTNDKDMSKNMLSAPFPFTSTDKPIYNLKGQILFDSWDEMLETGGVVATGASIHSFNEENIKNNRVVPIWHGVNPWGEKSHYNCEEWSSQSPLHVGLASTLEGGLISKQKKLSCNNKFHVLCIET